MRNLELQTTAKINISKDSDVITIAGTKEGIASARHEIQVISDEQVNIFSQNMDHSKQTIFYLLFVCSLLYCFSLVGRLNSSIRFRKIEKCLLLFVIQRIIP